MASFLNLIDVEWRFKYLCAINAFRVEIEEVVTEAIVGVVVEAAVVLGVELPTPVPQHTADLAAKHQKRKKYVTLVCFNKNKSMRT